jgi:hypothetical protein
MDEFPRNSRTIMPALYLEGKPVNCAEKARDSIQRELHVSWTWPRRVARTCSHAKSSKPQFPASTSRRLLSSEACSPSNKAKSMYR